MSSKFDTFLRNSDVVAQGMLQGAKTSFVLGFFFLLGVMCSENLLVGFGLRVPQVIGSVSSVTYAPYPDDIPTADQLDEDENPCPNNWLYMNKDGIRACVSPDSEFTPSKGEPRS